MFSPGLSRQRRGRDEDPTGLASAKLAFPSWSTAACEHLLLRLPCSFKPNLDRQEGTPMTDQLFLAPATHFRNLRVRDLNLFVFVWRNAQFARWPYRTFPAASRPWGAGAARAVSRGRTCSDADIVLSPTLAYRSMRRKKRPIMLIRDNLSKV